MPLLLMLPGTLAACATPQAADNLALPRPTVSYQTCRTGGYISPRGEVVVLHPRGSGRFVFVDGRSGSAADQNPAAYCAAGHVYVKLPTGELENWREVPLRVTRTHFVSNGTTLAGLLVEPAAADPLRPLVVQVQGSGTTGWINGSDEFSHEPYLFAAHGISSFVYDKHGTGQSAGAVHMNFHRLADDVVAASHEARRLARGRFGKLGLVGASQGGWVAPLAVAGARPDFLVVNYAGIFSPLEEDSEEVFLGLRERGYGEEVIAKARDVVAATHAIRASNYRSGFDELAQVKRQYGAEPWFAHVNGEFSGAYLRADEAELRSRAGMNPMQIPWQHDAMAVLRGMDVPTLWTRAGRDRQSAPGLTEPRLVTLQGEGKPIDVAIFPTADHAMLEFTEQSDGTRTYTRFSEGYYRLVIDWILRRISPPYGNATLQRAAARSGG
jgi:hypothetical protein